MSGSAWGISEFNKLCSWLLFIHCYIFNCGNRSTSALIAAFIRPALTNKAELSCVCCNTKGSSWFIDGSVECLDCFIQTLGYKLPREYLNVNNPWCKSNISSKAHDSGSMLHNTGLYSFHLQDGSRPKQGPPCYKQSLIVPIHHDSAF